MMPGGPDAAVAEHPGVELAVLKDVGSRDAPLGRPASLAGV